MKTSEENTGAASVSRSSARILRSTPLIVLVAFLTVLETPSVAGQRGRAAAPYEHADRVRSLVINLANQADLSRDVQFAVRAQAQAGLLVWPYDHDQARKIFRRAFRRLLPSTHYSRPDSALERSKRQQLRAELLNQIACCDPELADILARSFALSKELLIDEGETVLTFNGAHPSITANRPVNAEGRELLVGVALRLAEVDGVRAMQLAQLSLEAGISPYFDRLLTLVGASNPALADRLFSDAVDYLGRARQISAVGLHTLSYYLVSSVGPSGKDRQAEAAVIRFLNLAFDFIMRNCRVNRVAGARNGADRSFEVYCTGKYLMELLPRYLPDLAVQLQTRLSGMDDREQSGVAKSGSTAQPVHPAAIEQAARASVDARERDLLYARAALSWLTREDPGEAERAALNISGAQVRDRVLLPVARRVMSKARIKEAMLIARLIEDRVAKTDLIVELASAALAWRNAACAKTLLELAGLEAAKIEGPKARARALLAIVARLSSFDPARAFVVMQEATRCINDSAGRQPERQGPEREDLFDPGLMNSLTALARLDFDRALHLAQQLADKEMSLMARLAVCRGGLRPGGPEQR
jgi:hypothetical protein